MLLYSRTLKICPSEYVCPEQHAWKYEDWGKQDGCAQEILSYVTWSQQQANILNIKMLEKVYFLAVVNVLQSACIATWGNIFGYYY